MNDVACGQLTTTSDSGLTNFHCAMRIAFTLYGWATSSADCARDATAQQQVVVRSVDDCVDVLFHQVAGNDHDARRMHSSTSATRSLNSLVVAFAIPFTPTDVIVIDAQAAPHTSAS